MCKPVLKNLCRCLILVSLLSGLSACSTGEDEIPSSVEGEMDSELDGMTASSDSIGDGPSDADMEDRKAKKAKKMATKKAPPPAKGKKAKAVDEDEEFLADDSDSPAASEDPDAMAEQDLEKELEKGKAELPKTQKAPKVADLAPPPPMPGDVEEDMINTPKINAPAPPGVITSRESSPGANDFEYINPAPTLPKDDLGESDPLVSEVDPPLPSQKAAQEVVPISKVAKDPFFRNERLMNAVYIVRPGDDLGSISQKIFNEDKSANLLADNEGISKGVEDGDKIYYNSPNRPDDRKTILNYYEDSKLAPSYYTTEKGDDIQKIGRRVLGFEGAWKEIWATNESLQSQAQLPGGLKIKYWTGNESKSAAIAADDAGSTPPPSSAGTTKETSETPIDITNTPSDMEIAGSDPSMGAGPISPEPVPLLPDSSPAGSDSAAAASEDSNLGMIAGIALVVLAVLALVAIQIKNRKKMDDGLPPSLEFTKV